MTKLFWAAVRGHLNEVKELINLGVDPNESYNGITPLHTAACNKHLDVVKILINAGADINKADYDGWTALHYSAYYKRKEIVKLLINSGADINKADCKNGWTPLYWAARNGHRELVKELLANINGIPISEYKIAISTGNLEIAKLIKERMWQIISQKPMKLPPEIIWTHILPLILE